MTQIPLPKRLPLLLAALSCLRCSDPVVGGQTGDGSDVIGGDDTFDDATLVTAHDCDTEGEAVDNSAQETALGFSAEEVLAYAEGTFETDLGWSEGYGPETENGLELTIDYQDGGIELQRPKRSAESPDAGATEPTCRPFLAIKVQVTLRSESRALDDTFEGVLRAATPRLANLRGLFSASALKDKLSPAAGQDFDSLALEGFVSPQGTFGSLQALTSSTRKATGAETTGSGISGSSSRAAIWPSQSCAESEPGFPTPSILVDASLELEEQSLAAAVEGFEQQLPVPVRWQDGATSELALSLAEVERACLSAEGTSHWSLRAQPRVGFQTADGVLSGTLDGVFTSTEYGLNSSTSLILSLVAERAEFLEAIELQSPAADDYQRLLLSLFLTQEQGANSLSGHLHISGENEPVSCLPPEAESRDEVTECSSPSTMLQGSLGSGEALFDK